MKVGFFPGISPGFQPYRKFLSPRAQRGRVPVQRPICPDSKHVGYGGCFSADTVGGTEKGREKEVEKETFAREELARFVVGSDTDSRPKEQDKEVNEATQIDNQGDVRFDGPDTRKGRGKDHEKSA